MAEQAAPDRGTHPFRIAGDIGDKLRDLLEYLDVKSAVYLDPIVRAKIEGDYRTHKKGIDARRKARAAVAGASEQPEGS
ncbi:MAG: hypothetical protein E6Q76_02175 [Rhizobium sp.]|nr:MAG: hypothetical protein E6Q76_02175 [Rhizobium sp.]